MVQINNSDNINNVIDNNQDTTELSSKLIKSVRSMVSYSNKLKDSLVLGIKEDDLKQLTDEFKLTTSLGEKLLDSNEVLSILEQQSIINLTFLCGHLRAHYNCLSDNYNLSQLKNSTPNNNLLYYLFNKYYPEEFSNREIMLQLIRNRNQ